MSSLTLKEEKEKIKFEKNLERKNIILEKLFFGAIIVIFSIWGTILIEDFKSDKAQEQFVTEIFTEKRLEAITEIRNVYYEMFKSFALQTGFLKKLSKSDFEDAKILHKGEISKFRTDYYKNIDKFQQKESQYSALISTDFKKHLEYQDAIHTAIFVTDLFKYLDYRIFILEIAEHFDIHCRKETGVIPVIPVSAYPCNPWSSSIIMEKGHKKFLIEELKKWKEWKAKQPKISKKPYSYLQIKGISVTTGP